MRHAILLAAFLGYGCVSTTASDYSKVDDPAGRALGRCEAAAAVQFPAQAGVVSFGIEKASFVDSCMKAEGFARNPKK